MSAVFGPDDVRDACAFVVERASLVRIDEERLGALVDGIAADPPQTLDPTFAVTFGAVNFGSGWHPHLSKLPGKSGNVTISTRLQQRYDAEGPFSAEELARMTAADCASLFDQPLRPPVDKLMSLYARALNDLGAFLLRRFDGSFDALVEAAGGSAVKFVELLLEMPMYRDVAVYEEREVPFLKRAQLTASDIGGFDDLDDLTLFADNLIPHVLRVEGVLRVDDALAAAIDAGELLEPGGRGEVELRACAVVAGEMLAARSGGTLTPRQVDNQLWRLGQEPRFKASPRPRVRSWFY